MTEPTLSAHDDRVFTRLVGELDAYDMGMTGVPELIDRVGQMLDAIADVPPRFAEELREVWWPVQYTLALSRDHERPLSEDEDARVQDAVAELLDLLHHAGLR